MRFSSNISSLRPSATLEISARAKALAAQGRDIISLSAGQPDFPTPPPISEAGIRAIREGRTGYTPSAGIPELRDAVARSYSERRGIEWSRENVLVSCGAKHSLFNLVSAAVETGDRVLLPKPYWVSYPEMVKAAGGVPVLPEERISGREIRDAAAQGVVGVILNYPSNPTGVVPGEAYIEEIAQAVAETGVWVISDDIYEDLVYLPGGAPHILEARPDLADMVAVVTGVSKTYAMTGWRIGYSLASADWTSRAVNLQAHSTSNPCSVSQWAALAAVTGEAERERLAMLDAFTGRRDQVCELLEGIDRLELVRPEGAFYAFPRIRAEGGREVDTMAFCSELLSDCGVAVIPGAAFGTEGYVRISFAASEADIREGIARLGGFLEERTRR